GYIEDPNMLYFERGYGLEYGITDLDYKKKGANVVSERKARILEVMCQPKFCEADIGHIVEEQTVFGWLHLGQGSREARVLSEKSVTAIEWELMYMGKKQVFKRNSRLTGRIGVLHAFAYAGKIPEECRVAVIGRGEVSKGAIKQLTDIKVSDIDVYHSKNIHLLRKRISEYDVIVHCACSYDVIIHENELARMKRNALFIHMGSDSIEGKFEAQSIFSPLDWVNKGKNPMYCIDHVPTLAFQTASKYISRDVAPYIDMLIKGKMNKTLRDAIVIDKGRPNPDRLEHEIISFG
ncbi:MAG: hypothetical protein NT001_00630, partial [Candidatus Woesearchaeota archaeon]|nr:hypothetical protein [Candidatus Woesearchaeota archaeon]